jgi:hypothetical protein
MELKVNQRPITQGMMTVGTLEKTMSMDSRDRMLLTAG